MQRFVDNQEGYDLPKLKDMEQYFVIVMSVALIALVHWAITEFDN